MCNISNCHVQSTTFKTLTVASVIDGTLRAEILKVSDDLVLSPCQISLIETVIPYNDSCLLLNVAKKKYSIVTLI